MPQRESKEASRRIAALFPCRDAERRRSGQPAKEIKFLKICVNLLNLYHLHSLSKVLNFVPY